MNQMVSNARRDPCTLNKLYSALPTSRETAMVTARIARENNWHKRSVEEVMDRLQRDKHNPHRPGEIKTCVDDNQFIYYWIERPNPPQGHKPVDIDDTLVQETDTPPKTPPQPEKKPPNPRMPWQVFLKRFPTTKETAKTTKELGEGDFSEVQVKARIKSCRLHQDGCGFRLNTWKGGDNFSRYWVEYGPNFDAYAMSGARTQPVKSTLDRMRELLDSGDVVSASVVIISDGVKIAIEYPVEG